MWAMMQKFRTKACFVVTATVRMLGIMNAVLVIGALVSVAGVVLLVNLGGAADYAIRHLTSRSLGTLPPGFAASKEGFQVYALLVLGIGLIFLGLGAAAKKDQADPEDEERIDLEALFRCRETWRQRAKRSRGEMPDRVIRRPAEVDQQNDAGHAHEGAYHEHCVHDP